jgi:hypothetical protein
LLSITVELVDGVDEVVERGGVGEALEESLE